MTITQDDTSPIPMQGTVWLMITANGFYPLQPSVFCKPEDHGTMNDHVLRIETVDGKILWERTKQ